MPRIIPFTINYFWLRDAARNPIAVVAYNDVEFQLATRNPKDAFSKIVARKVATGRLEMDPFVFGPIDPDKSAKPYDQRIAVRQAIISNKKLPQPARLAAALWFRVWPQADRRRGSNRKIERRKV